MFRILRRLSVLPLLFLGGACNPPSGAVPARFTEIRVEGIPEGAALDEEQPLTQLPKKGEPLATFPSYWEGQGIQNDGQTWTVQVNVLNASPGHCADVVYPPMAPDEAPCAALWECDKNTHEGFLHGRERLIAGYGRCIDGCKVEADLVRAAARFDCGSVTAEAPLVHREAEQGSDPGIPD